ncbi:hypothetical protein Ami103574_12260 [Aminipila butyrica]|uniref:Class II Histidinyl-tRNA synthetase (HisRS)-like catalytic core domain-containing protein n=1 Tax=Aminipila butyrica TaxID=433296 RepID=A0A858BVQ6_9FIRM|nr:ATP phosphoribosyltransferase regulatory subunit [Aminipila butyrica]QIB70023.1 hypothetical protein Ami103574_12260 [Aminipila butyrica]
MKPIETLLSQEERITLDLRFLYESHGYSPFKMSKFEEYDLYARNKDFLLSDTIISFTDTDGRLMALKPDVTLSIIKNIKEDRGGLQKVYYHENIYRVSKDTHTYREFMQLGLECMGLIDLYHLVEVSLLAAASLKAIHSHYILSLSHMGILSALLADLSLNWEQEKQILQFIGEKNRHGIKTVCQQAGSSREACQRLTDLLAAYGPPKVVLPRLRTICTSEKTASLLDELERICQVLTPDHGDSILLDFSIKGGMNYYNGLVFQGFIQGIPSAVLSGGQYDKLMEKMGKTQGALGFAIYLDLLDYLGSVQKDCDIDVLLLYQESTDVTLLIETVKKLQEEGLSVQVQPLIPEKLKYKKLLQIKGGRLETLESTD